MMLEGDIQLRHYGTPNQTNEPVMAHPPDTDSDNTLDNWLESILKRYKEIEPLGSLGFMAARQRFRFVNMFLFVYLLLLLASLRVISASICCWIRINYLKHLLEKVKCNVACFQVMIMKLIRKAGQERHNSVYICLFVCLFVFVFITNTDWLLPTYVQISFVSNDLFCITCFGSFRFFVLTRQDL